MPYYDPYADADDAKELYKNFQKLTDMLCRLCKDVEGGKIRRLGYKLGADIQQWWAVHQRTDCAVEREREKAAKIETTKKKALAKLTVAEREALGL